MASFFAPSKGVSSRTHAQHWFHFLPPLRDHMMATMTTFSFNDFSIWASGYSPDTTNFSQHSHAANVQWSAQGKEKQHKMSISKLGLFSSFLQQLAPRHVNPKRGSLLQNVPLVLVFKPTDFLKLRMEWPLKQISEKHGTQKSCIPSPVCTVHAYLKFW